MKPPDTARKTLRDTFGFDDFRHGQGEVVARLLAGRSALAVFPTGGGKSLCYQLPALLLDGLTLVVSPLIALMKDQIDFLASKGVAAARMDSSLTTEEYTRTAADMKAGRLKLLYVSPERLSNERFLATIRRQPIALMAVDEAHCVSEWGHNFRPEYLKLARQAEALRVERVLALTATAPPGVAADIARAFGIAEDDIVRTGFRRPNLSLHVVPCEAGDRPKLLLDALAASPPGASIVYVTQQKTAEELAGVVRQSGREAQAYHAGMEADVRGRVQDWFMSDPNACVVATIAFGMGIDKADIRSVVHYNLPKSLENYAQEIGRAGRDGKDSRCTLLACAADRITLENFTYSDTPTPEAVAGLVGDVLGRGDTFDLSIPELSTTFDTRSLVVETLLTYLELEGVITATGMFYSDYKFQPCRPSAEILAKFPGERGEFLRKLLARSVKATKWFTLDVHTAAEELREPRERIVAALNYLEEQGDLTLKVAGTRQAYRRETGEADTEVLAGGIADQFTEREERDVGRVGQVLELAEHDGCRASFLAAYFGDGDGPDCGVCDWCKGERPGPVPTGKPWKPTAAHKKAVAALRAENHAALATPRQAARFLCGLASPATTRDKLTKDPRFGSFDGVPFAQVLAVCEKAWSE